jgi:hypothetical protein
MQTIVLQAASLRSAIRLTRDEPSFSAGYRMFEGPRSHYQSKGQQPVWRVQVLPTRNSAGVRGPLAELSRSLIARYIRLRGPQTATCHCMYMSTEFLGLGYALIKREQNWEKLCIADVYYFTPYSGLTLHRIGRERWITAPAHIPLRNYWRTALVFPLIHFIVLWSAYRRFALGSVGLWQFCCRARRLYSIMALRIRIQWHKVLALHKSVIDIIS